MGKLIWLVFCAFFMATVLVSANQEVRLPDYKKWEILKKDLPSSYVTIQGGCENKTIEELIKVEGDQYVHLRFDQYISTLTSTDSEFVDIVKNIRGKDWLLVYHRDDRMHLFKKKFTLLGYEWRFVDKLNLDKYDDFELWVDKVGVFQLRHCLWFPVI